MMGGSKESVVTQSNYETASAAELRLARHLRERRMQSNQDLDHVHQWTKVPLRSLELLEQGRFEELPADVFVRGFLKSYSNCIGANTETIMAMYEDCFVSEDDEVEFSESPADEQVESSFEMIRSMWRGEARNRGHVTVAAVLLAIVATLTMSYLLRPPSDRGDGITMQLPSANHQETLVS